MTSWKSFSVGLSAALLLVSGYYDAERGSLDSICPQQVRVLTAGGVEGSEPQMTALEVTYVGDCYQQGPFVYPCDAQGVCESPAMRFQVTGPRSYRWENLAWPGVWGEFVRVSD